MPDNRGGVGRESYVRIFRGSGCGRETLIKKHPKLAAEKIVKLKKLTVEEVVTVIAEESVATAI
jgi:hypothetical protein